MIKHYVEWFVLRGFFDDTICNEVNIRDIKPHVTPKSYFYGYRFYSIEEQVSPETGMKLTGNRFNVSPTTFIGHKMSYEQVMYDPDHTQILLDNMKCNNWSHVVKLHNGGFRPLNDSDIVISSFW